LKGISSPSKRGRIKVGVSFVSSPSFGGGGLRWGRKLLLIKRELFCKRFIKNL